MGKQTYAEKLRDPRWQKKRLIILQRDHWTWDASDDDLITLCENCHSSVQQSLSMIKESLVIIQKRWGVEGIDEASGIITKLTTLDPISLLAIRKFLYCNPDYSELMQNYKHG